MISEETNLYTYRQVDSVKLECSINLDKLFLTERERSKFLSPKGVVVAFQKNAWNGLKSDGDPDYSVDLARQAKLKGRLSGMPHIPLIGVPPTRLSGPCHRILRKCLIDTTK